MTGHVCPECGVHRPGCACAQAEIAAAEDFDPLRIRPYVTLDAAEPEGTAGAGGPAGRSGPAGPAGSAGPASVSGNYAAEDPPTTQLAAIRPDGPTTPYPAAAPHPAASTHPTEALPGPHSGTYADPHSDPYAGTHADPYADPYAADGHRGDPSETMPLLLHGIGRVADPADDRTPARGRRRGMVVAAVAAVAVVGTAALAAAVLGGGDEGDDRATGLEITTSASLNVAVSEAPSPSASSETPEPSSSSPSVRATTTSASPSATSTPSASSTAPSPSATTGAAAPPAATTAAPTTAAPTTSAPTTAPPTSQPPEEPTQPEEPGETEESATTLSYGSSGPDVEELQQRLTLAGAYHGPIDGEYGQGVWRAVKNYQSWMFIEDDPKGVYGPSTREALERSTWL
ncbi:peptidoglycan-binding domain-containing protein [Streptomyces gardneri]|uniref:peptidoglycan-binding domain-containing protein n=1 Tax=Streptomyces gardneri TaxID=66892 RepID=UPI0036A0DDF2